MRRVLPLVGALILMGYGCAGGGSSTTQGFGDDGGAGDDGGLAVDSALPDSGGSDAADSGPPKTCVHNDDCTVPNLCSGNNGVACMGGFCVPTGKPMNCDDGVACTNDSCDANTNKCKHTPNDAACPNNSYCDPQMNCVQTLPCTGPMDTVCDRLNTTACDGLWSCDGTRHVCTHGMKPCADRAHAATTCTAMGTMTTCSWMCNMGYVDLDMDLQSMGMSDGCECHITDTIDKPTLAMVDGNCDGIVGNKANAIFVDTVSGNDANPGTMAQPKKTIQGGIAAAIGTNPKDVYVSKGAYGEAVSMGDGVSIYGGYDAANGWARSLANVTTINSPTPVGAVTAHGLTKAVEVQLFTILSPDANGTMMNGDGMSSYGVVASSCTGGVTVRGCAITVGRGADGAAGADGSSGGSGSQGGGASGTNPGGGGGGCGGANGGAGAGAPGCTGSGNGGSAGTQVAGGGTAGGGGAGGGSGACSLTSSSPGGNAPANTATAGTGGPGANSTGGAGFGAVDSQGIYVPAAGGDGLTPGFPGGGGGGGGSGGGAAHGSNFFCTNCSCVSGGGGGGGGGGGCGGNVGHGGRGAGGSFAITVVSTMLTIDSTKMTTASGGRGGNGGNGGNGGSGGPPGGGAGGQRDSNSCSTTNGGAGAAGAQGGPGGTGGGAAGGSGGPSACVVWKGSSPASTNNQCTLGGGGPGGSGGTNGVNAASTGTNGQSMDTINSP